MQAAAEGAGHTSYKDWAAFDTKEVCKIFGMLFVNAVSPKTQFQQWFMGRSHNRIFGNDHFANALGKKLMGGWVINEYRRWQYFRQMMCMYDFRVHNRNSKDPLWKVASLLEEFRKNCQKCWTPGKWMAIDEQTIGFKGAHGLALQISYKREGDG